MRDLPILFSAPMVRALLAGTKTQTRRILKFGSEPPIWAGHGLATNDPAWWAFRYYDKSCDCIDYRYLPDVPRIKIGDRLWVKENFRGPYPYEAHGYRISDWGNKALWFTADGSPPAEMAWQFWPKARPSIHMPRWASRITLVVEGVKVERLQDISNEDCIAEGVDRLDSELVSCFSEHQDGRMTSSVEVRTYAPAYRRIWEHINGPGSWTENPWIVAYTFRVVMGNIDQIGGQP